MMKRLEKNLLLILSALLLSALILGGCMGMSAFTAEDTLSHSFTVSGDTRVVAQTFNGSITVTSGTVGEVSATVLRTAGGGSQSQAEQRLQQIDVTFEQTGNEIRVIARFDQITADMVGAEIRLAVPEGTAVEARTSNGDIEVRGVGGRTNLDTSNGGITLRGGMGETEANTSNGQIDLEAENADVTAQTSNGAITFSGSLDAGTQQFDTSNGEVELLLAANSEFSLDAHTSNGSVRCGFTLSSTQESDDNSLVAQVGANPAIEIRIRSSNGTISINPLP